MIALFTIHAPFRETVAQVNTGDYTGKSNRAKWMSGFVAILYIECECTPISHCLGGLKYHFNQMHP